MCLRVQKILLVERILSPRGEEGGGMWAGWEKGLLLLLLLLPMPM